MPGRGNVRFFFTESMIPTFVAFSRATTPPNTGTASGGSIIIPVPTGTADGDLLFAFVSVGTGVITPPAGWTAMFSVDTSMAYRRVASSEPASYTWTVGGSPGRGGIIATVRGGVLGSNSRAGSDPTPPWVCPSVAAGGDAGAIWIGVVSASDVQNNNDYVRSAGSSTIQLQYSGQGTDLYALSQALMIATRTNLTAGQTVSGETFTAAATATGFRYGIIIDPS